MVIEHKPVLLFTLVATLEDVLDYSRHTTNDFQRADRGAERKRARYHATEQTKIQMALKMIKDGELSLDKIANYTTLAIDRVKELATLQSV